jgi:WD40 repeat protein
MPSVVAPDEDDNATDESDSEGDCNFQCSTMLLGPQTNFKSDEMLAAVQSSAASHINLQGYTLASCHHDGSCRIWDLSRRRCIVNNINHSHERKFGLAVRRLYGSASNRFLYQTRDVHGTVTLHDLHDPSLAVMTIETNSNTFCTMSPCQVGQMTTQDKDDSTNNVMGGEHNLLALPTEFQSRAIVRDLRCNPSKQPAFRINVGQEEDDSTNRYNYYGRDNKYGMLMSLALTVQHDTQKLVLGCGMEDGSVLFYDLGLSDKGRKPWLVDEAGFDSSRLRAGDQDKSPCSNLDERKDGVTDFKYTCCTKLGKEPVLSLDLVSSHANHCNKQQSVTSSSLVAVAGCAGDADEMCDLPENEQGTVTTLKVSLANDNDMDSTMKSSIRKRTQTCSLSSGGKVGVSIARFRPDGRIFAVGGWDKRLRIFGRTSSKPLAILQGGHRDSVVAMDWPGNSAVSGLLATGAGDGKICIYRVFHHTNKECK